MHIQLLLHHLQKWQSILPVHHLALTPFFDFRILSVKIPIQYNELLPLDALLNQQKPLLYYLPQSILEDAFLLRHQMY